MGRTDDGRETAPVLAQIVHALDFRAHPNAPAAQNAFFRVAHYRCAAQFDGKSLPFAREMPLADAERVGEVLQLAIAVSLANLAVHRMVVQEQFDDVAASLADGGRVRLHLHAFPHLRTARRHIKAHAFDVDDADAARAGQTQVGMVAKPGDVDAQLLRRLHDRRALRHLKRLVVDLQRYFFLLSHC